MKTLTADEFAHHLLELLFHAYDEEPDRFADVESWGDLHAVCDGNDFVQDAMQWCDVPLTFTDAQIATINMGVDLACETLGWPEPDPDNPHKQRSDP